MSLEEIKSAVLAGKTVHHHNNLYVVIYDKATDQWFINCTANNYCIGLTWQDGTTMNGKPEEFYVV